MTTFQNPLGSLMPEGKKRELVALLARHDIPLVEDDVYGDLHHGQHRPPPAKAFDRRGLVLHCSSFSKTLAPGYRIGWAAAGRFHERVTRLAFASTLATASLPQAALATYLGHANPDRHLRTMRQHLLVQRDAMIAAVTNAFPKGTRITLPEGGYQLWVELPGTVDALTLYRQALARDIWIAPGPLFSARRALRHHIRLNYGQPWTAAASAAVDTVGQLAHDLSHTAADSASP
jgi:DNA-binding transcriptional MocR family regulator